MKRSFHIGYAFFTCFVFALLPPILISKPSLANDGDGIYSIFLIRHAEKGKSYDAPNNPPLTECGKLRAESLPTFFQDIEFKNIYSTNSIRTNDTANPTAKSQNLAIEVYDRYRVDELLKILLERKQDALVVGHRSTTPLVVSLLTDQRLDTIGDDIYDRVYQVVKSGTSSRIYILHQTFTCKK
jgi:phosphohistidine phosphatase SixA